MHGSMRLVLGRRAFAAVFATSTPGPCQHRFTTPRNVNPPFSPGPYHPPTFPPLLPPPPSTYFLLLNPLPPGMIQALEALYTV